MNAQTVEYLVIATAIAISAVIGLTTSRKVRNSDDYAVAGHKGSLLVTTGTLLIIAGSAATVGGAQQAFNYGLIGSSYTMGGAMACLAMGIFYARPLRESEAETIPQFISKTFGWQTRIICSVFTSIAIFVQIVAQLSSTTALISGFFGFSVNLGLLLAIVCTVIFVFYGGALSNGVVSSYRTLLIYCSLVVSGLIALRLGGGYAGYRSAFPSVPWFRLFGRGMSTDGASLISVVLGFLSSQQILLAMFTGKSIKVCREASFLAAIMLIPIGLSCVVIGMYMKTVSPNMASAYVLTSFLQQYTSPILAGLSFGALLLSGMSSAGALSVAISTMMIKDIYHITIGKKVSDRRLLWYERFFVTFVVITGAVLTRLSINTMILSISYVSMSLRAATVFLIIVVAMYAKRSYPPWVGITAVSAGPIAILLNETVLGSPIHYLYAGMLASALVLGSCLLMNHIRESCIRDTNMH